MGQVIIDPGDDGYWVAEGSSLAGCVSQGETKAAAAANIREAIELYMEAFADDGIPALREGFEAMVAAV